MSIQINKYFVKNTITGEKVRVHYSFGEIINDNRDCITVYAKEYGDKLSKVFSDVKNDSDIMTDYFAKDSVRIFKGDELFEKAFKFCS